MITGQPEKKTSMKNSDFELCTSSLRSRAEAVYTQRSKSDKELYDKDVNVLIHELEVHQIELEMQNEELLKTQVELNVSLDRYFELYDLAPVGYFTLDGQNRIIQANLTIAELLGVTRSMLIGVHFSQFVLPESQDNYYLYLKKVVNTGQEQSCELRLKNNGHGLFAHIHMVPVLDNHKMVCELRVVVTDLSALKDIQLVYEKVRGELESKIEERTRQLKSTNQALKAEIARRKKTEKTLKENERFSKSLVENSPIPIQVINPDTSIRYVNPAMEKQTGFSGMEIVGRKPPYPWWREEALEEMLCSFQEAISMGARELEQVFRSKKGEDFVVHIYCLPVKQSGRPLYYLSSWINITLEKHLLNEVWEKERLFRDISQSTTDWIWELDREFRFRFATGKVFEVMGYIPEELIGKSLVEFIRKEDVAALTDAVKKLENQRKPVVDFGAWWVTKGREEVFLITNGLPLFDNQGNLSGYRGCAKNITEQKKAKDLVLQLSGQLLQAQETERKVISWHLHDHVAQDLAAVKITCDGLLTEKKGLSTGVRHEIEKLSGLLRQCIGNVRDMSYDLRPPGLNKFGLIQAIREHCAIYSKKTGLSVEFSSSDIDGLQLDDNVQINLYRIVQEGLRNVHRHALAEKAVVELICAGSKIKLDITDNGTGFEAVKELSKGALGMGLRVMMERVRAAGGQMKILSRPGFGTKISVKIPL
ncbi:MAG: PAS domain S-box protein [Proteobacteria bacterium]|nr:PAS domain S-box protein [Pseudomonadota bacterium]